MSENDWNFDVKVLPADEIAQKVQEEEDSTLTQSVKYIVESFNAKVKAHDPKLGRKMKIEFDISNAQIYFRNNDRVKMCAEQIIKSAGYQEVKVVIKEMKPPFKPRGDIFFIQDYWNKGKRAEYFISVMPLLLDIIILPITTTEYLGYRSRKKAYKNQMENYATFSVEINLTLPASESSRRNSGPPGYSPNPSPE